MRHRDDFLKITREEIMAALDYDPLTGAFTWKSRADVIPQVDGCHAGKEAGCVRADGYVMITINRRGFQAARLAFVIMEGRWPAYSVDHKNTIKHDNRWENLREATGVQSSGNTKGYSKLGLPKGVWRNDSKFSAAMKQNGKRVYLGNFFTPEEAHAAYCTAAKAYFGEFARFK